MKWILWGFLAACCAAQGVVAQDGAALYRESCASCHDGGNERAPNRDALRSMQPNRVLAAMETGAMISMASRRSAAERRAIAEYVTGKKLSEALETKPSAKAMCAGAPGAFAMSGPQWNGWGQNTSNTRFQDAAAAGIAAADVPRLKVKWAFGFAGDLQAYGQPVIAGGRVFVGSQGGMVYSLEASTGCVHWYFETAAGVRAAPSIGRVMA